MRRRSRTAGPGTRRSPCSQRPIVRTITPRARARAAWERPRVRRAWRNSSGVRVGVSMPFNVVHRAGCVNDGLPISCASKLVSGETKLVSGETKLNPNVLFRVKRNWFRVKQNSTFFVSCETKLDIFVKFLPVLCETKLVLCATKRMFSVFRVKRNNFV